MNNVSTKDVLREFWRGLKPYRFFFLFSLIAVAAAALISVYIPLQYKSFFDMLTTPGNASATAPELIKIVLFVLLLNGINWILFRFVTFIQNTIQAKIVARLKQNAFGYLIDHSYTFFANSFTGALVQRVNRFARAFDRLADRVIWTLVPIAVNIIGVLAVMWYINRFLSLIILVWGTSFLVLNYFFSRWKVKYDVANAAADSETTAILSDVISNHTAVQLFTGFVSERITFRKASNNQAKAAALTWNMSGVFEAFQASISIVTEFLLFFISVKLWQQGVVSIGAFVIIQVYFLGLSNRLWDISRIIRDVYESFADAKEMVEIMKQPHEIKDIPTAKKLAVKNAEIAYKDVSFSYSETREVLNHINLTIAGGEKVALIGPSGAGKSTFVRLLFRMYELTDGTILIDNQDIHTVTQESLRKHISLVPQDPVLFHRSLKENIRYGHRGATDEEVLEAAKLAHCDEFVKDLPLGYDSLVGERGIKLSGGERQRIAIARAILKNAPILVLDEATSSLDSESEYYIQDALDKLMKGKTVIVIAHRLSTIRKMDRIIVLEHGKIREEGSHNSLLETPDSLYAKLWNIQSGGFLKG